MKLSPLLLATLGLIAGFPLGAAAELALDNGSRLPEPAFSPWPRVNRQVTVDGVPKRGAQVYQSYEGTILVLIDNQSPLTLVQPYYEAVRWANPECFKWSSSAVMPLDTPVDSQPIKKGAFCDYDADLDIERDRMSFTDIVGHRISVSGDYNWP